MQRELSLSLTVWNQPGENCKRSTSQCSHHKSPSPSPRGPPRPRPVSQAPPSQTVIWGQHWGACRSDKALKRCPRNQSVALWSPVKEKGGGRGKDTANVPKLLTTSLRLVPLRNHTHPGLAKSICLPAPCTLCTERAQSKSPALTRVNARRGRIHNHPTAWPLALLVHRVRGFPFYFNEARLPSLAGSWARGSETAVW